MKKLAQAASNPKLGSEEFNDKVFNHFLKSPQLPKEEICRMWGINLYQLGKIIKIKTNPRIQYLSNRAFKIIEEKLGVPRNIVKSKRRNPNIVLAKRTFCSLLLSRNDGLTTTEVGELLNLDHSTVIYHRDTNTDLCSVDAEYRKRWNEFYNEFWDDTLEPISLFWFKSNNGKYTYLYKLENEYRRKDTTSKATIDTLNKHDSIKISRFEYEELITKNL